MLKQNLVILFLLFSLLSRSQSISNNIQAKIDLLGLHGLNELGSKKNAKLLIAFCDKNDDNLVLPEYYLEKLLVLQYEFIEKNNLDNFKIKLAFPLASIYHDQSKFDKETHRSMGKFQKFQNTFKDKK